MTTPSRRRPIPRPRVALAGLGLLAILGAVILLGEVLRHPYEPDVASPDQRAGSDPRDEIMCPEPQPREGQERDSTGASLKPVAVSSNELFDCPQTYDGQRVVYRGEAIGALLERDTGVWTQLNDDVYAGDVGPLPAHRDYRGGNAGVGVLLPPEVAAGIEFVGGPQTRGDVLVIRGIFHRVDETGEVAVIRADNARVATRGEANPDPTLTNRRVAAWIAIVAAIVMIIAERVVAIRR